MHIHVFSRITSTKIAIDLSHETAQKRLHHMRIWFRKDLDNASGWKKVNPNFSLIRKLSPLAHQQRWFKHIQKMITQHVAENVRKKATATKNTSWDLHWVFLRILTMRHWLGSGQLTDNGVLTVSVRPPNLFRFPKLLAPVKRESCGRPQRNAIVILQSPEITNWSSWWLNQPNVESYYIYIDNIVKLDLNLPIFYGWKFKIKYLRTTTCWSLDSLILESNRQKSSCGWRRYTLCITVRFT